MYKLTQIFLYHVHVYNTELAWLWQGFIMNVLLMIVHRSEEPALTNMDISTGHMVLVSCVTTHHHVLTRAWHILYSAHQTSVFWHLTCCPKPQGWDALWTKIQFFPIVKWWALLHVQFFKTWKLPGLSERCENCVVVMPFGLVMRYQHFIGTWCLSLPVISDNCDTSPPSDATKKLRWKSEGFSLFEAKFKMYFFKFISQINIQYHLR